MNESTLHTRREFLRHSTLGVAAAWTVPAFLERTFFSLNAAAADAAIQTATGADHPILVVLQLAGGNDGLNTVVPFADDAYLRSRPTLGFKRPDILQLDDYCGLNRQLIGLKGLYDSGNLSIIQAVGYPNPNRSHFRSTEIWQTASDADKNEAYGWLGRYFDACCAGEDPSVGVSIGGTVPQAFTARNPTGISFSDPERYRWMGEGGDGEMAFRDLNDDDDGGDGTVGAIGGANNTEISSLDFLKRTALDAQVSSDEVRQIARKYKSTVTYPINKLGTELNLVAKMIAGGMKTRVFYVSQGGYDTHNGQAGTHDRLLKNLDECLAAFCADLKQQGNFNRVMVMTFSEFGRRVEQNANGGTDHGAAAPMFLLGGALKPGIHGKAPSLTDLYRGDLKFGIDFRAVYATMLEDWLKVQSVPILGRQWKKLGLI